MNTGKEAQQDSIATSPEKEEVKTHKMDIDNNREDDEAVEDGESGAQQEIASAGDKQTMEAGPTHATKSSPVDTTESMNASPQDEKDTRSNNEDDDGDQPQDESNAENSDGDEHHLSEYEKLRLERIKRNREYLSQLGLADQSMLGGRKVPAKRKKKKPPPKPQGPKRSSSRARKSVDYAEPSNSVAKLLRGTKPKVSKDPPKRKPSIAKQHLHRMEMFIFREFQRIKSLKTQTAKDAERNVRAAEKEVAYWSKLAELYEKREERKLHQERIRQIQEEEREGFGGVTLKELLHDIDKRMPELISAMSRYDEEYEVREREYSS